MTGTLDSAVSASPSAIEHDLHCIKCGYNLRTLAVDHRCPECNEPVSRTVEAWHSRDWARRIAAGLAWLTAGFTLWAIANTASTLPMLIYILGLGGFFGGVVQFPWLHLAGSIAYLLAGAALIPGILLSTRTSTLSPIHEQTAVLRKAVRSFAVATAVLLVGYGFFTSWIFTRLPANYVARMLIWNAIPIGLMICLMLYLSHVARGCDARLRAWIWGWATLFVTSLAIGVLSGYYYDRSTISTMNPIPQQLIFGGFALSTCINILSKAVVIVILVKLRRHIRRIVNPIGNRRHHSAAANISR